MKNLPRNYNAEFYISQLFQTDNTFDSGFREYLLASGEIGKHMQEEIDLLVTDGKLNIASVRQKLDSLYKSILLRQNPFELVFKDVSTFDGQNPLIENLLSEIEIRKQTEDSIDKVTKKAPSFKDIEIKNFSIEIFQAEKMIVMMTIIMMTMTMTMSIIIIGLQKHPLIDQNCLMFQNKIRLKWLKINSQKLKIWKEFWKV